VGVNVHGGHPDPDRSKHGFRLNIPPTGRTDDAFIRASAISTVLTSAESAGGKVWELWNLNKTHRFFPFTEFSAKWKERWKREHADPLLKYVDGRYNSTAFENSKAAVDKKTSPSLHGRLHGYTEKSLGTPIAFLPRFPSVIPLWSFSCLPSLTPHKSLPHCTA